jgi:DNA primase
MRGIDFREARARVRIAEVLELMGLPARRVLGSTVRGPCPLHRSRSPTSRVFSVHLDKNVYHCFRCGAGGNALDLWAVWTGQPLHAAVVDLYQRLGRAVPWQGQASSRPACHAAARLAGAGLLNQEYKTMHDP